MIYPLNELIDRYTIHKLKQERTEEDQTKALADMNGFLEFWIEECAYWSEDREQEGPRVRAMLEDFIERLYEINSLMWDAEAAIRAGQDQGLGLDEIGRRALVIRDLNRRRIAIKNEIVEYTGCGYKDIKVNYAR